MTPTEERIAYWLSLFAERLNRHHSDAMVVEYANALGDLAPEEIDAAGVFLYERETFTPPPGRWRDVAKPTAIDLDKLCAAIQSHGQYHPNVGWIDPPTRTVIERFGPEIGAAYASAGATRVFSDNEISREIARREFAAELAKQPRQKLEVWVIGGKAQRLEPPAPAMLPPVQPKLRGPKGLTWSDLKSIPAISSAVKDDTP